MGSHPQARQDMYFLNDMSERVRGRPKKETLGMRLCSRAAGKEEFVGIMSDISDLKSGSGAICRWSEADKSRKQSAERHNSTVGNLRQRMHVCVSAFERSR